MSYTSRLKLTVDNFSPETDLIEVFSKKAGVVGVINPSQISPPSGVSGAIQFSGGSAFASDASNLFWDNVNKRLGVGTNVPVSDVTINSATGNPAITLQRGGVSRGSFFETSGGTNLQGAGNGLWLGANGRQDMVFTWDGNNYSQSTSFTFGVNSSLGAKVGIKGSGSTSATTSFLVQNSSGTAAMTIKDDRSTNLNGGLYINTGITGGSYLVYVRSDFPNVELFTITENQNMYLGANTTLRANGIWYSQGQYGTNFFANNWYPQGGERIGWNFGGNGLAASGADSQISLIRINPAIGNFSTGTTNQGNSLLISPTINQVNTGTHTIRGIYYNPTLTSLTGTTHIAFENTTGDVLLNTTSGNTLIGSSASNTSKLSIKGTGSTSATTSLLVQNSSGVSSFRVRDDLAVGVGGGLDGGDGIRIVAGNNSSIVFTQGPDRVSLTRTNADSLAISTGGGVTYIKDGICNDGSNLNFWRFEGANNATVVMDTTKYLKVYVAGVLYKIAVCV